MSTPRIVITVEGGLVQNVLAEGNVRVVVVDYDVEGVDEDRTVDYLGAQANIAEVGTESNTPHITEAFRLTEAK